MVTLVLSCWSDMESYAMPEYRYNLNNQNYEFPHTTRWTS
jgi:hypothetical protein